MADSSEPSNAPHLVEEEDPQIINNQAQTGPIPIDDDEDQPAQQQQQQEEIDDVDDLIGLQPDDEDYPDDDDYVSDDFDEEDEEEEAEDEEEDSDSEEDDDDEEEEFLDPEVTSPRVSVNSVEAVGEPNGCGGGGKVEAAAEGVEVDGLTCSICMGPWTSGGDHQVCCLHCGHLYGLSCVKKWLERRKGSMKCLLCSRKCKLKDVRVLYASRVVVAEEYTKERILFLEANSAYLEKQMRERCKLEDEMVQREVADINRGVEERYKKLRQRYAKMRCDEDQGYEDLRRRFEQIKQQKIDQFDQYMQEQQAKFMLELEQQRQAGSSSSSQL